MYSRRDTPSLTTLKLRTADCGSVGIFLHRSVAVCLQRPVVPLLPLLFLSQPALAGSEGANAPATHCSPDCDGHNAWHDLCSIPS
jgi:hypothetical protein